MLHMTFLSVIAYFFKLSLLIFLFDKTFMASSFLSILRSTRNTSPKLPVPSN